ncbi:MAG TPA: SMC family ATPase [Candidatus Thermoplasmatota archaeon]|nr:SMC family ATPase [Candidatus Thermoplasmatota archaeon]
MILKSLHLKNYRKFKDVVLEFPDGITGVVGLNGVGKSTLFEAIAWALYGPAATRTSIDQIKREGAEPTDPCRVELEFIFEDDTYRVVREMIGKNLQASGTATVNGSVAATGADTLTRFIQRRLGMDWKSFYTSLFAKQKELNALSSMNPSERRQLILRMLGIDVVDDIIQEIRTDARDRKTMVEKLQADLVDAAGLSKKEAFERELVALHQQQKDFTQRIAEHKKQLQKKSEELTKNKKDCDTKKNEYESICGTKEHLDETKAQFEKKQRLEQDIKTRKTTLAQRTELLKQQQQKLEAFTTLEKDLHALEQQQQKNTTQLENAIKKQEQLTVTHRRHEEDVKELTQKKQHIEKMGPQAKCPTCERVLGQQHATLLKTYSEDITKQKEEMSRLLGELKTIQFDTGRLSREKQALQKKGLFLRNQEVERGRLQTAVSHLSEEINREERELDSMKKETQALQMVTFDEKHYEKIRSKVTETYKTYQAALQALDILKDTYQTIMVRQKEYEGKQNLLLQQQQQLEQRIQEQEVIATKLAAARKNAQHLVALTEIMDSYRSYLISQIRPTLSQHASELLAELSDGKYTEIELDEDYNLLVYDQGSAYGIERFSGGEEDLANLCIRLAISEIITERAGSVFQFIILDEIFGSQDDVRKQNIIKALNGFSSKFRQIFLITHVDDIKQFTEHTIEISESEQGMSTLALI